MSKLFEKYFNELTKDIFNLPTWDIETILKRNVKQGELQKEIFEVHKGNIKSTITAYFNKQGYIVYTRIDSSDIISKEERIKKIEEELKSHAEAGKWDVVHQLLDDFNELKKKNQ